MCISVPPKRRRSWSYAQSNMDKSGSPQNAPDKTKRSFKFGIYIPRYWSDLLRINEAVGNTIWRYGDEKKIATLIHHKCFAFKYPNFKLSKEYQYCRLHMIYDMRPDITHKARLVCDGSKIDPRGQSTRSTVVKGFSVRLLDLIAYSQNLKFLQGNISDALLRAHTKDIFVASVDKNLVT